MEEKKIIHTISPFIYSYLNSHAYGITATEKLRCKKEVMALRLMTVRTVSDKEEKADASGNIFLKVLTFFGRF